MNSRQGVRYIKNRMGNDLKEKILEQNGILTEDAIKKKSSIVDCPRCQLVNVRENKYCSKCSYPLKPEAYDEIKATEETRIMELEQKYENTMQTMRKETNEKFEKILNIVQQNSQLAFIKPEILNEF